MTCGIYLGSPKSVITDNVYIGQSINIYKRIQRHNRDMLNGVARPKLQEAYNKYGDFEWEIVEECTEDLLDEKEAFYIAKFDSVKNGFNTYQDANSAPILYGIDNGKVTAEVIDTSLQILLHTISNPKASKYVIADLATTKAHVVSHIWYGHTCKWLQEMYPVEYAKVRDLIGTRQIGGKTAEQLGKTYPKLLSPTFQVYTVSNLREFAKLHKLDCGDLSNVLNMHTASVKGWIVKDLDKLNPELHTKFYSTKRGHYKRQFDLYSVID